MYDTIYCRLLAEDCGGIALLEHVPHFLERYQENTNNETGEVWGFGYIGCLKVKVNRYRLEIAEGSLCKWYLGSNFHTMSKRETQRAVEALSKALELPMEKAIVTRLDVSNTIILSQPIGQYLKGLGNSRLYKRKVPQPNGVNYNRHDGNLVFYDKILEMQVHKEPLEEVFSGYAMRYEQRYTKRVSRVLNEPTELRLSRLYEDDFHMKIVERWLGAYLGINKVSVKGIDMRNCTDVSVLKDAGLVSLINDKFGGIDGYLELLANMQKEKRITRQKAKSLRDAVIRAFKSSIQINGRGDVIEELDRKMKEMAKMCK